MKIYITCDFSLGMPLSLYRAHKTSAILEKNIESSKHDFLPDFTTTIDQQYVIAGGSIQENNNHLSNNQKQYNSYNFHLLNLLGVEVSKTVLNDTE
jgi:methionine synthase I (cobalamin-dependent)